jgi:hypothetical protein
MDTYCAPVQDLTSCHFHLQVAAKSGSRLPGSENAEHVTIMNLNLIRIQRNEINLSPMSWKLPLDADKDSFGEF